MASFIEVKKVHAHQPKSFDWDDCFKAVW